MKSYDRITKFVPIFYLDVFEMDAIYRVDGEMLDELLENVDRVKLNRFILTADEVFTERMERFLGLKVYPNKDLDERRRLVAAYFAGFGKIGKTKIKEMMKSFTGADCEVVLKVYDEKLNQALYIALDRGENKSINADDVKKILFDRIPGHLMIICTVKYTNEELKNSGITYGYLKKFTYKQVRDGIPLEEVI